MGTRAYLLGVVLALALAVVPTAEAADRIAAPAGSTPALIERAADRGAIDRDTATLYLAYAVRGDRRLPPAYRASTRWDGTLVLRELHRSVRRMKPGTRHERAEDLVTPAATGDTCDTSVTPTTTSVQSTHFYIDYTPASLTGTLTITDYKVSLDKAWDTEVGVFGWAAPPVYLADPAPNNKYYVRIDPTLPAEGLYGFVSSSGSYAGPVGNNPATSWNEGDSQASCMAVASDYTGFPSSEHASLDATTAHEFNHSLQYGYGALDGANVPDDSFVEGGATWMEDEVQDLSNDNYNYLWPELSFNMGEYGADPYPYWITFRGLTERFDTGTAGGAEQVMQDVWEANSKNVSYQLNALNSALVATGTTLADAYHAYAVAVTFSKGCTVGGYAEPYCFEEGNAYRSFHALPAREESIPTMGGSVDSGVEDNYALNRITLPAGPTPFSVTLTNPSGGGQIRGTVACDTGTTIQQSTLPAVAGGLTIVKLGTFNPAACSSAPVAVITNQTQTGDNPSDFPERPYRLATGAPGADSVTHIPGPPGPGPGPNPGPKDTKRPVIHLKVSSRRALGKLLRSGLLIRVRSNEAAGVKADLLMDSARFSKLAHATRRVVVGSGSGRLAKARSKLVRIRLTRRAKLAFRKARSFQLVLAIRVTDAARNSRGARRRITIRR